MKTRTLLTAGVLLLQGACFDPEPPPQVESNDDTGTDGTGGPSTSETETSSTPTGDPDPSATSTSDTDADTDVADTDPPPDDTTDGPPAGCGNGVVEGDELCDDGDALDGNGCNTACEPSGALLWTATDGDIDTDTMGGVTVDASGNIYAAALVLREGFDDDAWVTAYDPDGTVLWSNLYDPSAGGYEFARDIAFNPANGSLFAVGQDASDLPSVSWLDDDGTLNSATAYPAAGGADGEAVAVAFGGGAGYVVANATFVGAGQPLGRVLRSTGVANGVMWDVSMPGAIVRGVGVDFLGDAYVVGTSDRTGFLQRRNRTDGTIAWELGALPNLHGVAVLGDGDVVVVGSRFVASEGNNVWVARFDADDQSEVWSADFGGDENGDDVGVGIAVDPDDMIAIAGTFAGSRALVVKLDPQGQTIWNDTFTIDDLGTDAADVAMDASGAVTVVGTYYGEFDGDLFVRHYAP